jgi:ribosomal protein S18 acetylase RimI-like enzyme
VIRAARPADADGVHALLLRWAAAVDEPPPARASLDAEWRAPGFDAERDHWLAERGGEVVGYAALRAGGGAVLRGEARELLPLAVGRARERGDERLEAIVTTRDSAALAAYEAAGWQRPREVLRMWLDLAAEPPEPSFPGDVRVRSYAEPDARPLHAFVELAYARNNERIEPFDEWLHFMTAHGDFDRAYWHLAEADGRIVACCLTWAPSERQGWVKDLAVHPQHRRRGLGEALLHHAARAYRAAGVERVGLKVDSDNPTSAGRLYERLGYRTDRTYAILVARP